MENLAEPLILLIFVKRALERGDSVRMGLEQYILNSDGAWTPSVQNWLVRRDMRLPLEPNIKSMGVYRRALLETLDRGLEGQSIAPALAALQDELIEVSEAQIAEHAQSLPFKLMIPLFVFIFPAFLFLLLGPLLL